MTKQTSVVTIDSCVFNESSLKLAHAAAILDMLHVIAGNKGSKELSAFSQVNALHLAMKLIEDVYDAFSEQSMVKSS